GSGETAKRPRDSPFGGLTRSSGGAGIGLSARSGSTGFGEASTGLDSSGTGLFRGGGMAGCGISGDALRGSNAFGISMGGIADFAGAAMGFTDGSTGAAVGCFSAGN